MKSIPAPDDAVDAGHLHRDGRYREHVSRRTRASCRSSSAFPRSRCACSSSRSTSTAAARRRPTTTATRSSRRKTRSRTWPAAACRSTCRRRTRCSLRARRIERERVHREIVVWGYFLGLIAGILLFGFRIAVPIFLVAVPALPGRRKLAQRAAAMAGSARSSMYLLFEKVLRVVAAHRVPHRPRPGCRAAAHERMLAPAFDVNYLGRQGPAFVREGTMLKRVSKAARCLSLAGGLMAAVDRDCRRWHRAARISSRARPSPTSSRPRRAAATTSTAGWSPNTCSDTCPARPSW